jgi:hypothetical protein
MADTEIDLCDVLEVSDGAAKILRIETLKTIAEELLTTAQRSVSIERTVCWNACTQVRKYRQASSLELRLLHGQVEKADSNRVGASGVIRELKRLKDDNDL